MLISRIHETFEQGSDSSKVWAKFRGSSNQLIDHFANIENIKATIFLGNQIPTRKE